MTADVELPFGSTRSDHTIGQYARVKEYLVRTSDAHEWPVFAAALAEVFMPAGFDCTQIEGWGDFRMRCGAAEVSFSGEDVGWQVSIEGPMDDATADALLASITARLGEACGEQCEWIQIT